MSKLACGAALCYNQRVNIVDPESTCGTLRFVTSTLLRRLVTMNTIPQDDQPRKRCTGPCSRMLPATTEFFHRNRGSLHSACKDCKRTYNQRSEVRARQSENRKRRRQENSLREAVPVTDIPTEKRCRGGCKRVLPATTEFFYRDKGTKDGLHSACKDCALQATKTYQSKPEVRTHRQAYKQEYRSRPKVQEHERVYNNAYWSRPDVNARKRAYDKARRSTPEFRERERLSQRAYLQRPEVRERHNTWRKEYGARPYVQERTRAQQREYSRRPQVQARRRAYLPAWQNEYYKRPEIQEHRQEWTHSYNGRSEVRDRYRVHRHIRRARKQAVPGSYTKEEIAALLIQQKYRCYSKRCGNAKFERRQVNGEWRYTYHIDHIIPLSRSECHPTNDISNIGLLCPSCNDSKGNKLLCEWPEGGILLYDGGLIVKRNLLHP